MSLVASQFSEDNERSKIMGFVLGSIALGVLVGYPIGSILYDIEGKMAPFLLVSVLIVVPIGEFFSAQIIPDPDVHFLFIYINGCLKFSRLTIIRIGFTAKDSIRGNQRM